MESPIWIFLAGLVIVALVVRLRGASEEARQAQRRADQTIREAQVSAQATISPLTEQLATLTGQLATLTGQTENRAREMHEDWRRAEWENLNRDVRASVDRDYRLKLDQWKSDTEEEIRADARQRSQLVVRGQVAENLLPYVPGWFTYNPKDAHFFGSPIDFIVFDGLYEDALKQIVFVEVKTGSSKLSQGQRQIRDVIRAGRVSWEEKRADPPGSQTASMRRTEPTISERLISPAASSNQSAAIRLSQIPESRIGRPDSLPGGTKHTGFALPATAYTTPVVAANIESGWNVHTILVGQSIRNATAAGAIFLDVLKTLQGQGRRYACVVLLLTSTRKLIAAVELLGTDRRDGGTVDAATIVRHASTRAGCSAIVVVGNRLSGKSEPTDRDHQLVDQLGVECRRAEIELQDYLVCGEGSFTSFRESGRMR